MTRFATANVELTPAMMADTFWAMSLSEQIDFFGELAKVIRKDNKTNTSAHSLGELQWHFVEQELRDKKFKDAREMLMTMAASLYWHTLNYTQGGAA